LAFQVRRPRRAHSVGFARASLSCKASETQLS
jgi:hypothetical protein